jgi:Methyltransferase domain
MTASYDRIGTTYATTRRPDPRIRAAIWSALGDAQTVVNVGAGSGSYEPPQTVLAVEPSAVMIAQRPPEAAPAVQASAEAIPLADDAVDAALAALTNHHWLDQERGFAEMRRVARRVVVLTWDPAFAEAFWLVRDYVPASAAYDRGRFLTLERVCELAGPGATVTAVPVPHDCEDGFFGAFWRSPEAYLDPRVRAGMSNLAHFGARYDPAFERLRSDIENGAWRRRNHDLLELSELDLGYRLVVAERPLSIIATWPNTASPVGVTSRRW